jgi:hypothetical protein
VTVYTAVQGAARGVLPPASIMMLFFVLSVALLAGARFADTSARPCPNGQLAVGPGDSPTCVCFLTR